MDKCVRFLSFLCAISILVFIVAFLCVLGNASAPAFKAFGLSFFTSGAWNPVKDDFGALSAIYGTIITSFIAIFLALPLGLGIALCLNEIIPPLFVKPIRIAIELLAGIPSIVYGFWGLFVLAPLFQDHIQPILINLFATIPILDRLFSGPAFGVGLLTAGCILAIMILPILTALFTDIFKTVSPLLKESAYALGATRFEVIKSTVIRSTKASIIGSIMLAFGRALGETMAVTFVIGNAHRLSLSLLAPGTTISASIANEFNEATSDLHSSSLIALGMVLFIITFVVLAGGRALVMFLSQGKRL